LVVLVVCVLVAVLVAGDDRWCHPSSSYRPSKPQDH
jgi:hypothetical protein